MKLRPGSIERLLCASLQYRTVFLGTVFHRVAPLASVYFLRCLKLPANLLSHTYKEVAAEKLDSSHLGFSLQKELRVRSGLGTSSL
jgi:hypothetical protein